MDDDPVAAAAGGEADVGVAAERSVDDTRVGVERLSCCQTRLARLIEGRCLRAEPDVLPLDHDSCNCLSS